MSIKPLGKSQRAKNTKLIASVAVFNEDGLMLLGQRGENSRWCCPGGHFEPNEYPTQAALRELFEETGLVPVKDIEFIGDAEVPKAGVHVYSFKVIVNSEPDSSSDPDAEFIQFRWLDPHNIPAEISSKLHNKQDVTLQCLGLQEKTLKSETKYWRANGIKIPHSSSAKRLIWDEAYLAKAQEMFGAGEVVDIDITKVRGYNMPSNQERVKLYKKMLGAGEALPPVVVRYDGDGFNLIDGNHRQEACQQTGKTLVKALLIVDLGLKKMAVAEIPRGNLRFTKTNGTNVFNYSHILSPEQKSKGLEINVEHEPDDTLHATLISGGQPVGYVRGQMEHGNLRFIQSDLEEPFRGRGLGMPVYESVLAHAHHSGATSVSGNIHSSMASRVHQKLAEKHALEYQAKPAPKLPGKKPPKGPYDDRVGAYKYTLKSEDTSLEKGLGLSMLLGGALMGGAMNPVSPNEPKPTAHSILQGAGIKTWTPEGLDKELYPIAHLESSFGQNVKHAQHPAGEFHTAYGALGLKPSTGFDEYNHNAALSREYPGLNEPADFHQKLKTDPVMYNKIASAYFKRLKARHGSAEEAARAYRYGTTAVFKKHPEAMADKEGYVAKYKQLAGAK